MSWWFALLFFYAGVALGYVLHYFCAASARESDNQDMMLVLQYLHDQDVCMQITNKSYQSWYLEQLRHMEDWHETRHEGKHSDSNRHLR